MHPLVRSPKQLDRVLTEIENAPGIVLYTLLEAKLAERLEATCRELGLPCLSILGPVLGLFQAYLGGETKPRIVSYCTGNDIEQHLKFGYKKLKLAIPHGPADGREGMRKNVALVKRTRDMLGPDGEIMLDCWMSWNERYTLEMADMVAPYRVYWMEECLQPHDYEGFGRRGWVGDYMDPYTFLYLFYSPQNSGATGWWDPKFDRMLDEANNTVDPQVRYEKLAAAELYMMQKQIVVPLGVPGTSWLKKPYVKGLYPNPGTLHPWKFVYIERDQAKWDTDVENLMTFKDPVVQEQIASISKSQEDFEKSKASAKTAE
jgi:hypothetical protein